MLRTLSGLKKPVVDNDEAAVFAAANKCADRRHRLFSVFLSSYLAIPPIRLLVLLHYPYQSTRSHGYRHRSVVEAASDVVYSQRDCGHGGSVGARRHRHCSIIILHHR